MNLYYEKIIDIMRRERKNYWDLCGGKYTHTMPTFLITKYFNQENILNLTGPEMFKAMNFLCKQGLVIKSSRSRIGQAHWQLTDGEGK